jgi:threonine dehydratase
LDRPTLAGVLAARKRIRPFLPRTPLYTYPSLDRLIGASVCVKHENHLPIGAFKVRGGVNLISQMSREERARGVIAASTGNHGQSVAYAARLFGVRATICVPEDANPVKVRSMRDLEARIVFYGADYDDAREHCERLAAQHGYRYIHSGNEPLLIEGVGTLTLEILEDRHDIDVIIVPVGGGSGAAGACITAKTVRPGTEVIGVQAAAAPAAYLSWRDRKLVESEMKTTAEGLATRTPFELPQSIMWEHLNDFVLLSEDEIRRATQRMLEITRNLVEEAGAAALGAATRLRDRLRGRRVALICSGGNVSPAQLKEILSEWNG